MKRFYIFLCLSVLLSCAQTPNTHIPSNQKENPQYSKITVPENLAQYYKTIDFNKTGKTLYDDLAVLTISKHTKFLTYYDRHKYLYKADASLLNPNNVVLMYTGEERYWEEYEGNKNYSPTTFNTEHIYPQSKYQNNAKGDLHHLRACDKSVNSRRGNLPFTQGKGSCKIIGKGWYPGDEWKGDIARMIFYLNLRYNEKLDTSISTGGIALLLKWNDEDPVSPLEHQRNNVIEGAQGNRNPFIDFPQLARRIYE